MMYVDVESIIHDLNVYCAETEADQYLLNLIAKTLLRIPVKTRERVIKEVMFIVCNRNSVEYFPIYIQKKFIIHCILINFCAINELEANRIMSVIANKIAHFVLGHKIIGGKSNETDADNLVKNWGL